MAAYVDLDTMRAYLGRTRGTDVDDDDFINVALVSASDAINDACQRNFTAATTSSARVYVAPLGRDLWIHDCTDVTSVIINGSTIAATNYQLGPVGLELTGEDRPFTYISHLYTPWYTYESIPGKAVVSVTASWGWPATPSRVIDATKIIAKDILANKDVRFGIAAFTEYAGIRARENPQVEYLAGSYPRRESWGIA